MINYLLNFLTGITLFLFGINNLCNITKNINKHKFINMLKKINNKFQGLIIGILITSILQSSSFVTILVITLIDSNILTINSSIGIILGSNIGTCLTAWIFSLSSINLFNIITPSNIISLFSLISIVFFFLRKNIKANFFYNIMITLLGMNLMNISLSPLANTSFFQNIFISFSNPILGLLLGIITSCIFQSSSIVIGLLESLSLNMNINFLSGLTIILGSNIGTCTTTLIASIKLNKTSKVLSIFHLLFNLFSSIIILIIFYLLNYLFNPTFIYNKINPITISLIHTFFNIISVIIIWPFTNTLYKISSKYIKTSNN